MNPISLADLLSTPEAQQADTQWLIPDLLPIGLTLLQGGVRVGKSWLTLHLALSAALGTSALGSIPTTQTDVLYLGLQDTPQHIIRCTHKLLGTRPAPDNILWTNQWDSPSSPTDPLAENPCTGLIHHTPIHHTPLASLDLWLAAHPHTRLVIIDSLQNLSSQSLSSTIHCNLTSSSLNTPTGQNLALLQQLKALADKHQIALLVVDGHIPNTKRNACSDHTYNPSFALADAIMTLKRERSQTDAILLLSGPDIPDAELALSLPTDTMTWTLLGPAHDYRLSQERQDILALLEEHSDGPLRPKEIASLLHKDVRAVTKLLFDMSHASQVRLLGRGQYTTIKSTIPTKPQLSQIYSTYLEKLHQTFASTPSNNPCPAGECVMKRECVRETARASLPYQKNIGNESNQNAIGNGDIGNDGNQNAIGNENNYSYSTCTNLPYLSSLNLDIPNSLNHQTFSPIDIASFHCNHPPISQPQ